MIAEGMVTVTVAEPDFVVSCVDVAVIVAVPSPDGAKRPALLTAPMLAGLTDHVTDELKLPVPATVGEQVEVCVVRIDAGEQTTRTEVIVGLGGGVPPLLAPLPPHAEANMSRALRRSTGTKRRFLFLESRHDWKAIFQSPTNRKDP